MALLSKLLAGRAIADRDRAIEERDRAVAERDRALADLAAARARAEQTEELAGLGLRATSFAHAINNPLAYVKGNLELLLLRVDGKQAELVADALAGVERIRELASALRPGASEGEERPSAGQG